MRWICFLMLCGCGAVIEPGHRGLLFKPRAGGLQHDVLGPGWWHLAGIGARIDDFDVTYSTRKEALHVVSKEGAEMEVGMSIRYRPIVSELYDLDVEIGPNYYDEVIAPEWRSATRGLFARHSYLGLLEQNEKLEDEIEQELRRRIGGKHVEVSSVTMDRITVAPEVMQVNQQRILGEQEAVRKRTADEDEAKRIKLAIEHKRQEEQMQADAELAKLEHLRQIAASQAQAEKEKHQAAAELEKQGAEADAQTQRVRAEAEAATAVIKAKADSQALTLMAKARAEEKRAESAVVTPMQVMMHAYDALGKLGGENTTVMMGDFSKLPNWLFPNLPAFNSALTGAVHPISQTEKPLARN
jgi:regulator of protease activity HflC (stomatin/prohibitin superfamily)